MSDEQLREKRHFALKLCKLAERKFPETIDGFDKELGQLRHIDEDIRSNLDEFYTASLGSSMAKNRFADVKPNERTIVQLPKMTGNGDGTYINANYIDARKKFNVPFVYIATQAPMKNTVLDFWRMVYDNDSAFVVMLCGTKENGKVKSETYWPAKGETCDMGVLAVTVLSETSRQDSVHRRVLLRTVRGDEKEVYHMQYIAWPDQGVPHGSAVLMEMIQTIAKSPRSTQAPIVVHCSGGVGRTGVFIGMHIALAQFQLGQVNISIPRIVRFLKCCRCGMVRRKDQYLFLYYAVQREMDRMILSAKAGVNLLDVRPRTSAEPALNEVRQSRTSTGPVVMPMPTAARSGPRMPSFMASFDASKAFPKRRTSAPRPVDPESRSVAEDTARMESYLLRSSPTTSIARSPSVPLPLAPPEQQQQQPTLFSVNSFSSPPRPVSSFGREDRLLSSSPSQARLVSPLSSGSLGSPAFTHLATSSQRGTLEEQLMREKAANRIRRFTPASGGGGGGAWPRSPQSSVDHSNGASSVCGSWQGPAAPPGYGVTAAEIRLL